MRRHHVIAAHVLDVQKLILCRYLRQWDDLNAIFLAVGRAHKQVAEVARPFGAFHGLADVVHVLLVQHRVGHVHDETCVAAVDVILQAEHHGGLIQQGGRNCR